MEDNFWDDPHFNTGTNFQDALGGDSPFNAFNDLTNLDQYAESPGMRLRTPSKTAAQNQQGIVGLSTGPSAESSSQDSASDSSSRRKRKVSESPISDPATETGVKQEDAMMEGMGQVDSKVMQYEQYPTRPMHDLSLEQDQGMFDFNSAGSSPIQPTEFTTAMSLNRQAHVPPATAAPQYHQSPVSQTLYRAT